MVEVGVLMSDMYDSIDKLRAKVDGNQTITVKEACFVLWAEVGVCSSQYLKFKNWCTDNKLTKKKTWPNWKAFFLAYRQINNG